MINSSEFIARLKKIITYYDESASGFAEQIGVQRSSISHILSGRNKPSLDFVMKVLHTYPEVDLYWLMNGTGEFPKTDKVASDVPALDVFNDTKPPAPIDQGKNHDYEQTPKTTSQGITISEALQRHAEIERIVVLFKDGSFKSYEN